MLVCEAMIVSRPKGKQEAVTCCKRVLNLCHMWLVQQNEIDEPSEELTRSSQAKHAATGLHLQQLVNLYLVARCCGNR